MYVIVSFCCDYFLALGGQSETLASSSVPTTPQLHAVVM